MKGLLLYRCSRYNSFAIKLIQVIKKNRNTYLSLFGITLTNIMIFSMIGQ